MSNREKKVQEIEKIKVIFVTFFTKISDIFHKTGKVRKICQKINLKENILNFLRTL